MQQKIIQIGNSMGITIPSAYIKEFSLREGTRVEWEKTDRGLTLLPQKKMKARSEIDPKVARLIEKISKKYTQVWHDLAKV